MAVSVSFEKTLFAVFKEKDEENDGHLSIIDFTRILVYLGSTLSFEDISVIAGRYKATENYGKGRNTGTEFNGFYDSDVEGTKMNFSSSGTAHTHARTHTHMHTHTYIYTHRNNARLLAHMIYNMNPQASSASIDQDIGVGVQEIFEDKWTGA